MDPARLPEALPSAHVYGTTTEFGGEVPVAGIAGDQQAALFGQACHAAGQGKNTYGTGSFVLLNAGRAKPPAAQEGLLTTIAWGLADEVDYALEAAIFVTGAAVQWLRDGLGVIGDAAETEALAASLDVERRGVLRARADRARLAALGSVRTRHDRRPDPRQRARAPGSRRARGDRLPDGGRGPRPGGGCRRAAHGAARPTAARSPTRWLMQFQADVLGVPVSVPEISETTALGAAYLAGIATGVWTADEVAERWREAARYEPRDGRATSASRSWRTGAARWSAPAAGSSPK